MTIRNRVARHPDRPDPAPERRLLVLWSQEVCDAVGSPAGSDTSAREVSWTPYADVMSVGMCLLIALASAARLAALWYLIAAGAGDELAR